MDIIKKLSKFFHVVIHNRNKANSKKEKNCNFIAFINLIIIFTILTNISSSKEKKLYFRKINLVSEIVMKIKGNGEQEILNSYISNKPDEIYINGVYTSTKVNKVNTIENENTIKMVWNSPLTSCSFMFYGLTNIIEIDLSKFDSSSITEMVSMFNDCTSLILIDLSNFNINKITNMESAFHDCCSLKYINLKNFNTSLVTNMHNTFYNCSSLTSLDVTSFNTSLVNDMQGLFGQLRSLKSLNLSNFNTSLVTNMEGMFGGSISLLSLDLSKFNISLTTNFIGMFSNCESLIFLNIEWFIKTKMENINSIASLQTENMFDNINSNLILCVDTQNQNIEMIKKIVKENILNNNDCQNICFSNSIKIDINSLECLNNCELSTMNSKYDYNNICNAICPMNTHKWPTNNFICKDDCEIFNQYYNYDKTLCIDEIPQGYFVNDTEHRTIDICHPDCKDCEKKSDAHSSNCKSCLNNKFLYLGNCLTSCQNGFTEDSSGNKICNCFNNKCKECSIESNDLDLCISCNDGYYQKIDDTPNPNSFINCYKDPDNYYLDQNIYKPCYSTCKKCSGDGTSLDNKCLECKPEHSKIENNQNNCYQNCKYYYYFDSTNNYHCTEEQKCPPEQNKLIKEKNKCIKNCIDDDIYKCEYNNICYESCPEENKDINIANNNNEEKCPDDKPYKNKNICVEECDPNDFFKEICKISNDKLSIQEDMIKNIREKLTQKELDTLLLNVTDGEKKDLLIKSKNIRYQITTTDNQNNKIYSNISTIKMQKCEEILKKEYEIDKDKSLIIFKIDYYMEGLSIPVIGYEVYDPDTKKKLNLSFCDEVLIDVDIPVSIDEDKLFKYDPNSDYYNDECYTYTTDNGTDILLNDRKEEFIDNNLSLCENNCSYKGYEGESKKASCKCEIKSDDFSISKIFEEENILSNNFTFDDSNSNIKTMKCINALFKKKGLIANIASYILIVITFLFSILFFLYFKFGSYYIEEDIKKIISQKKKNEKMKNKSKEQKIN